MDGIDNGIQYGPMLMKMAEYTDNSSSIQTPSARSLARMACRLWNHSRVISKTVSASGRCFQTASEKASVKRRVGFQEIVQLKHNLVACDM